MARASAATGPSEGGLWDDASEVFPFPSDFAGASEREIPVVVLSRS